jgi:hypothetical protein
MMKEIGSHSSNFYSCHHDLAIILFQRENSNGKKMARSWKGSYFLMKEKKEKGLLDDLPLAILSEALNRLIATDRPVTFSFLFHPLAGSIKTEKSESEPRASS